MVASHGLNQKHNYVNTKAPSRASHALIFHSRSPLDDPLFILSTINSPNRPVSLNFRGSDYLSSIFHYTLESWTNFVIWIACESSQTVVYIYYFDLRQQQCLGRGCDDPP